MGNFVSRLQIYLSLIVLSLKIPEKKIAYLNIYSKSNLKFVICYLKVVAARSCVERIQLSLLQIAERGLDTQIDSRYVVGYLARQIVDSWILREKTTIYTQVDTSIWNKKLSHHVIDTYTVIFKKYFKKIVSIHDFLVWLRTVS